MVNNHLFMVIPGMIYSIFLNNHIIYVNGGE